MEDTSEITEGVFCQVYPTEDCSQVAIPPEVQCILLPHKLLPHYGPSTLGCVLPEPRGAALNMAYGFRDALHERLLRDVLQVWTLGANGARVSCS